MLIPRTMFKACGVASKDLARFQLCGVHIHRLTDECARVVATDGKRMAIGEWNPKTIEDVWAPDVEPVTECCTILPNLQAKQAGKMEPTMPRASDAVRLCENPNGKIMLEASDGSAKINAESLFGTYPNYAAAITDRQASTPILEMWFSVEGLLGALKTAHEMMPGADFVKMVVYSAEKPAWFEMRTKSIDDGKVDMLVMPLVQP
jgi:hypothetical protein